MRGRGSAGLVGHALAAPRVQDRMTGSGVWMGPYVVLLDSLPPG